MSMLNHKAIATHAAPYMKKNLHEVYRWRLLMAGPTGETWSTKTTVAKKTKLHRDTVRTMDRQLISMGLMYPYRHYQKGERLPSGKIAVRGISSYKLRAFGDPMPQKQQTSAENSADIYRASPAGMGDSPTGFDKRAQAREEELAHSLSSQPKFGPAVEAKPAGAKPQPTGKGKGEKNTPAPQRQDRVEASTAVADAISDAKELDPIPGQAHARAINRAILKLCDGAAYGRYDMGQVQALLPSLMVYGLRSEELELQRQVQIGKNYAAKAAMPAVATTRQAQGEHQGYGPKKGFGDFVKDEDDGDTYNLGATINMGETKNLPRETKTLTSGM